MLGMGMLLDEAIKSSPLPADVEDPWPKFLRSVKKLKKATQFRWDPNEDSPEAKKHRGLLINEWGALNGVVEAFAKGSLMDENKAALRLKKEVFTDGMAFLKKDNLTLITTSWKLIERLYVDYRPDLNTIKMVPLYTSVRTHHDAFVKAVEGQPIQDKIPDEMNYRLILNDCGRHLNGAILLLAAETYRRPELLSTVEAQLKPLARELNKRQKEAKRKEANQNGNGSSNGSGSDNGNGGNGNGSDNGNSSPIVSAQSKNKVRGEDKPTAKAKGEPAKDKGKPTAKAKGEATQAANDGAGASAQDAKKTTAEVAASDGAECKASPSNAKAPAAKEPGVALEVTAKVSTEADPATYIALSS